MFKFQISIINHHVLILINGKLFSFLLESTEFFSLFIYLEPHLTILFQPKTKLNNDYIISFKFNSNSRVFRFFYLLKFFHTDGIKFFKTSGRKKWRWKNDLASSRELIWHETGFLYYPNNVRMYTLFAYVYFYSSSRIFHHLVLMLSV